MRASRRIGVLLALAGAAIAGYLTVVHYRHASPMCLAGGHGCATVAKSRYSILLGLPVPLWGLAAYLCLVVCHLRTGLTAATAAVAITLIGVGISGYLTYLELAVIHAICQWCVASAVVMTTSAVVALRRYLAEA